MSRKKSNKAIEIIEKLKKVLELRTDTELGNFLGLRQNTISGWRHRNTVDFDIIIEKCKDVDLNWLFAGKEDVPSKKVSEAEIQYGRPSVIIQQGADGETLIRVKYEKDVKMTIHEQKRDSDKED